MPWGVDSQVASVQLVTSVALAVGVALDAFVVRMTLVPAVMKLLGRHAWWLPSWLDKRLPVLFRAMLRDLGQ